MCFLQFDKYEKFDPITHGWNTHKYFMNRGLEVYEFKTCLLFEAVFINFKVYFLVK